MKGDSSCEDANANFARITRHQRSSKSPICRLVVRDLSARPQCPTMNALKSCAVVGLLTTVVFAQELSWSELARRPELWPAQCTAKEKMTFDEEKKELIYTLGCVLEKTGKKQEAIEQFELIYATDIGYKDVAAKVDAFYSGS